MKANNQSAARPAVGTKSSYPTDRRTMKPSRVIVLCLAGLVLALLHARPALAAVDPTAGGPTLPSANLDASHCGYQVPEGATVHSDGTITDAAGNALTANKVCSYDDLANNRSTGRATNVNPTVGVHTLAIAGAQPATNFLIDETFQQSPYTDGWYSLTMSIQVPTDDSGTAHPDTIRWMSGLLTDSSDRTFLGGALQLNGGNYTVYPMMEMAPGNGSAVYGPTLSASPGDVISVRVQVSPSPWTWDVSVANARTNQYSSINVQYNPALLWAIPAAMDARNNLSPAGPIDNCGLVPSYNYVHFASPQLVPATCGAHTCAASPVGMSTGFADWTGKSKQPNCIWNSKSTGDFVDLIWGCLPQPNCGSGSCGVTPDWCDPNVLSDCGSCQSGFVCNAGTCGARRRHAHNPATPAGQFPTAAEGS